MIIIIIIITIIIVTIILTITILTILILILILILVLTLIIIIVIIIIIIIMILITIIPMYVIICPNHVNAHCDSIHYQAIHARTMVTYPNKLNPLSLNPPCTLYTPNPSGSP